MIKIETFLNENESFNFEESVVCIGFFDGIHKMHDKIISKAKSISENENLNWNIITFTEKVSDFLNKTNNNIQLKENKYLQFKNKYNPNFLIEIQVNKETITKSAEYFCDFLKTNLKVKKIVVGDDFRFGYKGTGDVQLLRSFFGEENVILFKRVKEISTSLVRENIISGNIEEIKRILDRNIFVTFKKIEDKKFSIIDFNLNLANGLYEIKMDSEIQEIEILENKTEFNIGKDVVTVEVLRRVM
ncbi:hypothetical protein [Spiroplasma monobiae]|nr:hypothetical protein [Spiroplasma monobiae]